jgi:hypothetical protein
MTAIANSEMVRRAAPALLSSSWRPRQSRTAPIPIRPVASGWQMSTREEQGMAPSTLADRRVRRFNLAGRAPASDYLLSLGLWRTNVGSCRYRSVTVR